MGQIITVGKTINPDDYNSVNPETTASWWQVIEELETEFVIEIIVE